MPGPTVSASLFVNITPGVLAASGNGLDLIGLMLTTSTRVPIGSVYSFNSLSAVQAFFGAGSTEANEAQVYFLGFNGSTKRPGALLFAQYPTVAVAAYLQGGPISSLTLAQLQAITGVLTITVDGQPHTSSTINLSAATSFSNAAALITTALASNDAAVTGAISPAVAVTAGTTTIAANVMTVVTVASGSIVPGAVLTGGTVVAGTTVVSQLTGTAGQAGTYQVSVSQTMSAAAITATNAAAGVLTVSAVGSGVLGVGQVLSGSGVTVGTQITGLLTGTTGTGTYIVSPSQTASSTAITAGAVTVTYDSVSGAFMVTSGSVGAASTISFATGTASAALMLTQATGAVTSQGSAIATPSVFMTGVVAKTQSFASFTPLFTISTADRVAFSQWNNGQGNRFAFICWDTDITVTLPNPTTSAGYQIIQAGYSGTILDYELSGQRNAAFIMGAAASVDYTATNGRATLAYKSQSGIVPGVTDNTTFANLITNGYNFYVAAATANQEFDFFYNGSITGPFKWADSYFGQIWLNSNLQLAIMTLFTNVTSVPYNAAGYAQIEAACADPINAALNAGVIRAGVPLSAQQAANVNAQAGKQIDTVLSTRGWYLLITPASAATRQGRTSPPCTLWYTDGESVQQISLASINIL